MSGLRAQLPETCPTCGHDPAGDRDEFTSGGGWSHSTSVTDDGYGSVWVEEMYCPLCGETVARKETRGEEW